MDWLKGLVDSLMVHTFFKVADTPDRANWWYDKEGNTTDDEEKVVRKEPVEIPRWRLAKAGEYDMLYDREFTKTNMEDTAANHRVFQQELKKHIYVLIDKHLSNRTYETTDFAVISVAESFLNWLDVGMIGNPQPMTELAKAVDAKVIDRLPYDIRQYRLFSFDDVIRIHYHFNEGDDPEEFVQLVFSRENIELAIHFERLFTAADERSVVDLLEGQFSSTRVTGVPAAAWLDNVEKIIMYHHLLKRQQFAKHDAVILWFKEKRQKIDKITMAEVFLSYSWDSPEHGQLVFNFTNYLREKGFDATIDKMISQKKTATDFVRMMHEAFLQHPKVIVILSGGYKQKAESFSGGVGEEYELLINDIKKNEQKYILASFGGRSDGIVPMGLAGRDIIDLSKPEEHQRLFAKLMDQPMYEFAPVGAHKPVLDTIKPEPFVAEKNVVPVSILPPRFTPTGNISSQGGVYTRYELMIDIDFKNISKEIVHEFACEVQLNRYLVPEQRQLKREGDIVTMDFQVQRKIFPAQTTMGLQFQFEINRGNIYQLIDSEIKITVFTEQGNAEASFLFRDRVKLKRPNEHWAEAQPITLDMFVG